VRGSTPSQSGNIVPSSYRAAFLPGVARKLVWRPYEPPVCGGLLVGEELDWYDLNLAIAPCPSLRSSHAGCLPLISAPLFVTGPAWGSEVRWAQLPSTARPSPPGPPLLSRTDGWAG
jgi:hypothetical protein